MALIICPECGRKVSDRAAACPECGYPIAASNPSGFASIKIGDVCVVNSGWKGAVARATITVLLLDAASGQELGSGKIGSVINIKLDGPKQVILRIKGGVALYNGEIEPKKRYEIVKLPALFRGKFALNEIDVIDSGL